MREQEQRAELELAEVQGPELIQRRRMAELVQRKRVLQLQLQVLLRRVLLTVEGLVPQRRTHLVPVLGREL